MKLRYLPNLLTVFRMLLALPVAWAIVSHEPWVAVFLFFIAALSDGLDGFLARHYHWQSRLGVLLDPLADKFLLLATYTALSVVGALPVWITLLVVGRDLLIVGGVALYRWRVGAYEFNPNVLGKLSTLFQLCLALAALVQLVIAMEKPVMVLLPLTALFTLVSGLQYVIEWRGKWLRSGISKE